MATDALSELLIMAQSAATSAEKARECARPAVIEALRTLEAALKEALGGEPLRGLKNIGVLGEKLYAARVRTHPDSKLPKPNDKGGMQRYLCVSPQGDLVVAYWAEDDGVIWLTDDRADDDVFRVDDLKDLVDTLAEILPRHVKAARSTSGRYLDLQRLAHRIRDAVKEAAA